MIVVGPGTFDDCLSTILQEDILSFDFETTGLYPYKNDQPFLLGIASASEEWIFDSRLITYDQLYAATEKILAKGIKLILHNAKFDLAFADKLYAQHGDVLDISKLDISDIMVLGRLVRSNEMKIRLDSIAQWYGLKKDDAVKEWITKNKAYKFEDGEKCLCFDKVPFEIIHPYAAMDVRVTYDLYWKLMRDLIGLEEYNKGLLLPKSIFNVWQNEKGALKTLFLMEKEGVLIDVAYTKTAGSAERARHTRCSEDFKRATGRDFVNSGKALYEIFRDIPEDAPKIKYTEQGNPSFTDEILSVFTSEPAAIVKEIRDSHKKAGTYYENFIRLADDRGRIHTDFRQAGPRTGRLSSASPNLQNLSKVKKIEEHMVRGCYIPDPGDFWLSLDYSAQEFCMLLDMAEEMPVIEEVRSGKDPHLATAELLKDYGVDRDGAKTINFALLYGQGIGELANNLGCPYGEAKEIKNAYFRKLPQVGNFINQVTNKIKSVGMISNWYGRVYKIERDFAYKGINYIIQGGCSEVMKTALTRCASHIKQERYKTKMLLTVHDEICFSLNKNEFGLIPELQEIMSKAYVHKHLPLTTSAKISPKGWAWVTKDVEKARNQFLTESLCGSGATPA